MTGEAADWEAPARAGFSADDGRHRRNLRSLANYLRSPHIGKAQIQEATIGTAHIEDLAVTDAKIENLTVSKLTTGTLQADVILSGKISTAPEGQRVEIDINGIRLIDGEEHQTVTIPVVGEARFEGSIVATGLQVTDDAAFSGDIALELGSEVTLASSVSQPVSAPGLAWMYPSEPLDGVLNDRRSLAYDASDDRWIVASTTAEAVEALDRPTGESAWVIYPRSTTSSAGRPAVYEYNVVAAVREANNLWVIGRWTYNAKKYLLRYQMVSGEPTDDYPSQRFVLEDVVGGDDNLQGLTFDGSDLLIMFKNQNNALRVARYSTTGNHEATITIDASIGSQSAYSITYRAEGGANIFVVIADIARGYTVAGARITSADFPVPAGSQGLAHDGGSFWSAPASAPHVNQHSDWTTTLNYLHVSYTYFLTTGSKESTRSPVSTMATKDRAFLRISTAGIPTGADRIRIYALEHALITEPALGSSKLQATLTEPFTDLDQYLSAGAADPTVSTFVAAGTPAVLLTQDAGFELHGDGTMILPKFTGDPAGEEGRIYMNTTTHKARVHNGTTWNDLF